MPGIIGLRNYERQLFCSRMFVGVVKIGVKRRTSLGTSSFSSSSSSVLTLHDVFVISITSVISFLLITDSR